jgi:hypothetical protein
MKLPPTKQWSIDKIIECRDDGVSIAHEIVQGTAVAVSDRSFKHESGASAWVIDGAAHENRIMGCNIVPGTKHDHSAYRSELVGLLGIVSMVQEICSFYKVHGGSIEAGCNNVSALDMAFDKETDTTLQMADHDIVAAI